MQNSYESVVLGAFKGIFLDAFDVYPESRKELERDLSRLITLYEARGFSFLTITLPDCGKHFDACLSSGCLTKFNAPGFGARNKVSPIPRFLGVLVARVFHPTGLLCSTPDITAILFLRQVFNLAKKVRITCDESRTQESVRDFFRIESSMRNPTLDWIGSALLDTCGSRSVHLLDGLHSGNNEREDDDSAIGTSGLLFQLEHEGQSPAADLLRSVQRTADVVAGFIGEFVDPRGWTSDSRWRTKHGPGAVADLKGGDSKYRFPNWPAKLEGVFPYADLAFANYTHWVDSLTAEDSNRRGSLHEPPTKLIAVPKTQKGPRLIASEPTAHQWCQQAVNNFLRARVSETFLSKAIHFRDQSFNREAALLASKTGTHWTIDLSSASDCLSLWCTERLMRVNPPLLRALHACRTRWIENTIDPGSPKYQILKKVAPQGAAFTFPLQSIIYTMVILGCMIHASQREPSIGNLTEMIGEVRVFGDDLIVPDYVGELVVQVLTYLGFKVNDLKTFKHGKFRESCGLEAYDGHEVTPSYILEPYDSSKPTSVASVVDCSNNFFMKGFWRTAEMLVSTLPLKIRKSLLVVRADSGILGLTSYCGSYFAPLKRRFNKDTQQYERKCRSVVSTVRKLPDQGAARLLQYFTEAPSPDIFWASGIDARPVSVTRDRWVPEDLII